MAYDLTAIALLWLRVTSRESSFQTRGRGAHAIGAAAMTWTLHPTVSLRQGSIRFEQTLGEHFRLPTLSVPSPAKRDPRGYIIPSYQGFPDCLKSSTLS